jgi:transcriptional regulator with XRE-family HTH domain
MQLHIREYRERKGLTVTELGRRIGSDHSFLSRAERGLRPLTVEQLMAISRELNVGIEYLVDNAPAPVKVVVVA